MRTGGIILCGGLSSRMGQPKAWLPFEGELFLQRIVRIVSEAVNPVVVVAAREQKVPPLPAEVAIVWDEVAGCGPLQGLAAGLAALDGRVDAAYLSSCDVPLLTTAFARSVVSLASHHDIAIPHINGFHHPLSAVYHLTVLPHIRIMLAAQQYRLLDLLERVPTRYVEAHELSDLDSLRNVNTPEEYAAALAYNAQHSTIH